MRLCVDEYGPLNVQPRHGRHWARGGHVDRLRATYHRTNGVRLFFGVCNLERDRLAGRFAQRKNWRTFLSSLKWVRRRYAKAGTLRIVLYNVGYHRRATVLAYVRKHDIRFCWTPTGASWLNRIECHFIALCNFALDNTDY